MSAVEKTHQEGGIQSPAEVDPGLGHALEAPWGSQSNRVIGESVSTLQ